MRRSFRRSRTFVVTGRTRRIQGSNLVPVEFEIAVELPGQVRAKGRDSRAGKRSDVQRVQRRGDDPVAGAGRAAAARRRRRGPGAPPGCGPGWGAARRTACGHSTRCWHTTIRRHAAGYGCHAAGGDHATGRSAPHWCATGGRAPAAGNPRPARHRQAPQRPGDARRGRARAAPGCRPADGPAVPPIDPRKARLYTIKQDFAKLTLGMFAASFPTYPLTFTYAGQAEAPQGKADVIDVKGEGNFALRMLHQQPDAPADHGELDDAGDAGQRRDDAARPTGAEGPRARRDRRRSAAAAGRRPRQRKSRTSTRRTSQALRAKALAGAKPVEHRIYLFGLQGRRQRRDVPVPSSSRDRRRHRRRDDVRPVQDQHEDRSRGNSRFANERSTRASLVRAYSSCLFTFGAWSSSRNRRSRRRQRRGCSSRSSIRAAPCSRTRPSRSTGLEDATKKAAVAPLKTSREGAGDLRQARARPLHGHRPSSRVSRTRAWKFDVAHPRRRQQARHGPAPEAASRTPSPSRAIARRRPPIARRSSARRSRASRSSCCRTIPTR